MGHFKAFSSRGKKHAKMQPFNQFRTKLSIESTVIFKASYITSQTVFKFPRFHSLLTSMSNRSCTEQAEGFGAFPYLLAI